MRAMNERGHELGWAPTPAATAERTRFVDHYKLLSLAVQVRSADDWFVRAMRWHLKPFRRSRAETEEVILEERTDTGDGDRGDLVYSRNRVEVHRGSRMGVLHYAIWDVHRIVPTWSRDFLFVHAGSVARHGRGLLLPAPPGRGKSSLVAALLLRGFAYLSEELGAIDPVSGRAYPFPKRLSLDPEALRFFPGVADRLQDRAASGVPLAKRYARPEDFGADVAAAAPVDRIVFLGPQRPGPPRVTRLAAAETVERLAASCLNLYRYQERGVVLLSRVASAAEAFELSGGDPNDLAATLDDLASA
jgi:hypothetical protein